MRNVRRRPFRASSRRSTTSAVCIPRLPISARNSSKTSTPAGGQTSGMITFRPKGPETVGLCRPLPDALAKRVGQARAGHFAIEKPPMRFELGVAAPATWAWGRGFTARETPSHQVDDKGNRHPEMRRGRAARMTFIDIADNSLTQIKRIRFPASRITSLPEGNQIALTNPLDSD
jgi:hypothetical protein